MGHVDGSPFVLDGRTQMFRCVLVLELLHPFALGMPEEKSDHDVVEATIHKLVDDRSQHRLPPQLLELAQGESSKINAVVA